MQGNIRQRGTGSWELRVFVGRDPATGRKRYLTKTVRGGKRQAQRELVTLVYTAQQGAVSRSRSTVADLLAAWFDHACSDLSPKTVRETRGYLDRNLIPHLGEIRVDRLLANHGCVDVTRRDGIDPHALDDHFFRHSPSEAQDAGLSRRVVG